MADFKHVKRVNRRDKNIVYGFMRDIQLIFPENNTYYTLNQLIQDLCLLYFHTIIDSKILTEDEIGKLLDMIDKKYPNKIEHHWKLLFRGSRHGFNKNDFYQRCEKIENTICVIHTPQDNVFGGFARREWVNMSNKQDYHCDDERAFVFSIRSSEGCDPKIFPVLDEGKMAIQQYPDGYLSFGYRGSAFFIGRASRNATATVFATKTFGRRAHSKEYGVPMDRLNGSETSEVIAKDIEVFQVDLL